MFNFKNATTGGMTEKSLFVEFSRKPKWRKIFAMSDSIVSPKQVEGYFLAFNPVEWSDSLWHGHLLLALTMGLDPNVRDRSGNSMLHLAAKNSDGKTGIRKTEMLLRFGANPDAVNSCMRTPLMEATSHGCFEAAREVAMFSEKLRLKNQVPANQAVSVQPGFVFA